MGDMTKKLVDLVQAKLVDLQQKRPDGGIQQKIKKMRGKGRRRSEGGSVTISMEKENDVVDSLYTLQDSQHLLDESSSMKNELDSAKPDGAEKPIDLITEDLQDICLK